MAGAREVAGCHAMLSITSPDPQFDNYLQRRQDKRGHLQLLVSGGAVLF
jgi:hypothetical protein